MNFTEMAQRHSCTRRQFSGWGKPDIRWANGDWDLLKIPGQLRHQIWYEVWVLDCDYIWNKTRPKDGLPYASRR